LLLYANSNKWRYSSHFVGQSITYIHNISSKIWLVLSVWPSVWGLYVVLKFNWVSKPLQKAFQKFKVNFVSLSGIIFFGIPCILKICFMKISGMSISLWVDFIGMKCANLVSLSTTIIIESFCFLLLGSPVIKSTLITSRFHSRMGIGYNNATGCWYSTLTCWHSRHLERYSTTSVFIQSHK